MVGGSNGSGNSSSCCDPDNSSGGIATKRQCYELSGNTSDAAADTANPAAEGSSLLAAAPAAAAPAAAPGAATPFAMPQQQQQQQQAGDPSQLGLWFANQQLQQLHLQEQVQHNMELQQQAHMQMQQQMAAHMQMRTAGQLVQQQMAAAPFSLAGAAMAAAAAAGMLGLPGTPPSNNCFDAVVAAAAAASAGFPVGLPAISAPPSVLTMQQLASCCMGSQLGLGMGSAMTAAAAYGSPLAAYSQQLHNLQQQQQAANIAAQLMEPTSPLATAAAAAAAAWPSLVQTAADANGDQMASAVAAAAAAALGSPRVAQTAATAAVSSVFDQLPLPQLLPRPLAPLQPALPESHSLVAPPAPAPAAVAGVADVAGQLAADSTAAVPPQAAAPAAAAQRAAKPVKAVKINPQPEVNTCAQNWLETRCEAERGTGTAAQAADSNRQQERSSGAAVPAVSGATAGCVSGFTGGAQGVEALDEVDTLLSRPQDGLFSEMEGGLEDGTCCGDGCGGSDGCWKLLGIAAADADSEEGLEGEDGGCEAGSREQGESGGQGWGVEVDGVVSSAVKEVPHRPDSALAHVFDYGL